MTSLLRRALLVCALIATTAWAQDRPSESLELRGAALLQPRTFTPAELAAQPTAAIGSFVQSRGAPGSESRSTVLGVRLARLIESAGLTQVSGDTTN